MADITKLSSEIVRACVAGDWPLVYDNADPRFARGVTEFMNAEAWRAVIHVAGNLKEIKSSTAFRHLLSKPTIRSVFVRCQFERGPVVVNVSFTHEDKIIGLSLLTPDSPEA